MKTTEDLLKVPIDNIWDMPKETLSAYYEATTSTLRDLYEKKRVLEIEISRIETLTNVIQVVHESLEKRYG